ncbi:Hypothetical protein HDN1F_18890 [gamma proteobacterium HdN1]|nr:Hypothetical protein HDN1F_18890 [gamma proteobacterium HdN1]
MSTPFEPKGQRALATIISRAELNPMPATCKAARAAVSDANLTDAELTTRLLDDPAIAASILREVARQLRKASKITLSDMAHCQTLLGNHAIATVVKMLSPLPATAEHPNEWQSRSALVTGLFAATMISDWQQAQPLIHYEQCYLAALLTRLPEWVLWREAPKEMKMITTLIHRYDITPTEAERLVLGCTLNDLMVGLAHDGRLSDILINALDHQHLTDMRPLLRWAARTNKPHISQIRYRDESMHRREVSGPMRVLLANAIAVEARTDWFGKGMRRCITLLAAWLEISEDAAWRRICNSALQLARRVPDIATAALAAGLLAEPLPGPARRIPPSLRAEAVQRLYNDEPLRAQRIHKQPLHSGMSPPSPLSAPQIARTAHPDPTASQPSFRSAAAAQRFDSLLEQLTRIEQLTRTEELSRNPSDFKSVSEALTTSLHVLHECSQIERILFLEFDAAQGQFTSKLALGCEQAPALTGLQFLIEPPNLFTRLIKQPAQIWVSPERQKSSEGFLPSKVYNATQTNRYFASSLFRGKRPLGVLYADNSKRPQPLTEADYAVFRRLVNALGTYLARP